MTAPIIIVGAGGHAKVVADALLAAGRTVVGFVDPAIELQGTLLLGLPVLGDDDALFEPVHADCELVNGIGSVGAKGDRLWRRSIQERLEAQGRSFTGVRHPSAIVSPFAEVDPTAQLLARSVVQAGARIGRGVIINTGVIVEHDCQIGVFCHCAPGALLSGMIHLGENMHIGAGAVVMQGLQLTGGGVVAAGAVVIRSYDGGGPLVGVPATDRGRP
jgi:sugar O-acyltransferase (sialic acid O-acetyltransferase NeuD family)